MKKDWICSYSKHSEDHGRLQVHISKLSPSLRLQVSSPQKLAHMLDSKRHLNNLAFERIKCMITKKSLLCVRVFVLVFVCDVSVLCIVCVCLSVMCVCMCVVVARRDGVVSFSLSLFFPLCVCICRDTSAHMCTHATTHV